MKLIVELWTSRTFVQDTHPIFAVCSMFSLENSTYPTLTNLKTPSPPKTALANLAGGWTNPFEKYESNWIIFPDRGKNIKPFELPPPDLVFIQSLV